ncbi:Protein IQ-DOMAIN 32 [Acorus calamus]|uniref:Protein IQ-DOMAIN 32 n=1 Tax=Acorus calamus TaxID=4465 RepID=A0AAV9DWF3_ACOCL|nr:Protein IQ-DOMAIN 32 [Acorus calamus]
MGKSTISCFKMIPCATDSVENEDLEPAEDKTTTDKRRWSFRKRSARHRVLSNSVISELPSAGNKESPEATVLDYHAETNLPNAEKIAEPKLTDEKHPPSSAEIDIVLNKDDLNLQESSVTFIQAAIRAYVARRELQKVKSVVRLQAAIRRHLVRRQAGGTLRCVQAIIKMQALVRARRMRRLEAKLPNKENIHGRYQMEYFGIGVNKKLFANGFARQLLESAPKTKPIFISCDPSGPDSAWKWLERWMAVFSSDIEQRHHHGEVDNTKLAATEVSSEFQDSFDSASADMKSASNGIGESHFGEPELTASHGDVFDFQIPPQILVSEKNYSSEKDEGEVPKHDNNGLVFAREISTNIEEALVEASNPLPIRTDAQSWTTTQAVHDCVSEKPENEPDNTKAIMEKVSCELIETEGKKFTFGLRKSCNPAFVAAQSKFEELSSTPTSARSINSTSHNAPTESRSGDSPSQTEPVTKSDSLRMFENSISNDQRIQVGGSECGTEISISSTLDSPDRSEIEGGEIVLEIGASEKEKYVSSSAVASGDAYNLGNLQVGSENISSSSDSQKNQSDSGILHLENLEEVDKNPPGLVVPADVTHGDHLSAEQSASDSKVQVEVAIEPQVYRSSPEGSPRTASDLFTTPLNQTSSNTKRNRTDNSVPTRKQRSLMTEKSPSNSKNDSGARSSTEHLPKEKIEKRRNSFGMPRPDQVDHEASVSNSNSRPNYMQATESAKAKVHANSSPKASPDVQDKDNYMKKRHSLPTGNGKQGSSPRMQRSSSQAQQNGKANAAHSPHNPPDMEGLLQFITGQFYVDPLRRGSGKGDWMGT